MLHDNREKRRGKEKWTTKSSRQKKLIQKKFSIRFSDWICTVVGKGKVAMLRWRKVLFFKKSQVYFHWCRKWCCQVKFLKCLHNDRLMRLIGTWISSILTRRNIHSGRIQSLNRESSWNQFKLIRLNWITANIVRNHAKSKFQLFTLEPLSFSTVIQERDREVIAADEWKVSQNRNCRL